MVGALLFVAPVSVLADPPPFDGWTYNTATGHYYKIIYGFLGNHEVDEASAVAAAYGGYVATIDDAAEENWICDNLPDGLTTFGIGLNDRATEGTFTWTGPDSSYRNWGADQPPGLRPT